MRISKIAMIGAGMALVTLISGCSTVSVTTDYDHSAPFPNYRTYALQPPTNVLPFTPSADAALRSSLRANLAARGIREVAVTETPELAVVPHMQLQQNYSVQQYTQGGYGPGMWPYYGGYYGVWAGAPFTYSTIQSYTEGTLILDFVDTSKQKLVFRGIGSATVGSPENNAKKIEKAVTKIVSKLPPPTQQ